MPLWTDVITPVEATGIARAELQAREQAKGSLSRFLPNVSVADDHVKFIKGEHGLVDEAYYRAYNAAPEIISSDVVGSTLIELVAMSNNQPIDERTQKALRRLPEDQVRKSVEWAIRRAAWSIADRNERTRGQVIHTGKALANQHNFILNDDFGRDAALSFTAPALWSDPATDRMAQLDTWLELYATKNRGDRPGCIVMSDAAFSAFARGAQFHTVLVGGATRMPMAGEVNSIIDAAGYPSIEKYNRSTKSGLVLPKEWIYFLPSPTDPFDQDGTELGATFYGQTVTSESPEFDIAPGEQPGVVVGVYREDRIPYTVEVMADAITLPVARDANRAMAVKVL